MSLDDNRNQKSIRKSKKVVTLKIVELHCDKSPSLTDTRSVIQKGIQCQLVVM